MKHLKTFENYKFEPATMNSIRKNNPAVNDFCESIENENGNIKDIILSSDGEKYLVYYTKEDEMGTKTKAIKKEDSQ